LNNFFSGVQYFYLATLELELPLTFTKYTMSQTVSRKRDRTEESAEDRLINAACDHAEAVSAANAELKRALAEADEKFKQAVGQANKIRAQTLEFWTKAKILV